MIKGQRGDFSIETLFIVFLLLIVGATYFSGVYQALVETGGDPIFYQIIGTGIILLAFLGLMSKPKQQQF